MYAVEQNSDATHVRFTLTNMVRPGDVLYVAVLKATGGVLYGQVTRPPTYPANIVVGDFNRTDLINATAWAPAPIGNAAIAGPRLLSTTVYVADDENGKGNYWESAPASFLDSVLTP